ncbi:MAG: tRNA preQ1(34) S-adenosylmethionine ribosyltransferase-isomerase QueA [Oscillospiraceae bacterium]|nr:tRNA preQ1(34) S-adenosylmethionine ribosyltransferase-isomerase QueA [Oscillospiraceae bacterium]
MLKKDFSFILPDELIAQTPLKSRDNSRLLCMERISGQTSHRFFYELPDMLSKGDCLVLNDSRVLPARLLGRRETGGFVEVLLLCEHERLWECLVRPGRKVKTGTKLIFGNGELTATVKETLDNKNRLIEFHFDGIFLEVLESLGKMPLPPYIHEELKDAERYQTVYSREVGSAAAPTAGLHFTHELLDKLKQKGIEICYITLHVGLGTFRPVKTEKIEDHTMHDEFFVISKEAAAIINQTKENGGRVIAVGTTSCRTIEAVADSKGRVSAQTGSTDMFIYPGYEFKCIDGLITNFHLPESTLIMLVSAFAGRENTLRAYEEAISLKYRFFSFGDAMLIL